MIFRRLIWLIPISPLIIMASIMMVDINIVNFMLYINKIIGATFCHVKINKQFGHLNPSITSGNQKWNGAIPIFVRREEFIINTNVDSKFIFLIIEVLVIINKAENKKIVEATDCVMKYLTDDSEDKTLLLFIRGIIDNILISKPSHIPNQEYDEIEIRVLKKSIIKNIIL